MTRLYCRDCGTTYNEGERHACALRDPLLVEREKTHGSFEENAKIFCKFLTCLNYEQNVNDQQRLAIMMIFAKIARIHSGNPNEKDHWNDIAGYAKLGAEACDEA